ncbi:sigma-54-dependent transcriptional regulator [Salmonella enterica]|uniref:PRD domain-containing protein n=1 Tax=Salmonella typhimurium TaxID=90371 RepID=A0A628N7S5_SALTM|nr:sigma-54-dependent transcriptional regulator [Salmonella enterica]EKN5181109.1 sigma-54-dependent transcriptional regulator [Salmonella enterica subsp. enterica]EAA1638229.1 PRD domain-containing protein [Salmonella enterica]EAA5004045.1 PRD domain-containing protein [Salmonella enterica]EAM3034894.1 PRD domain-containing protein [Salmonella enterica]EAM3085693.1 PRD domain-containing protein [Salmonella enterica]
MNKESIFRQLELRLAGCSLTADALGAFSAMAIADSLRQKRSIISHHLNNLHREQRVVKVNSRPVLFLPVEALRRHHRLAVRQGDYASIQALCAERQDSLELLIGAQGSLQESLRQCKAAISYPGAGLPLLLRGPTGTGKSFLARQLWQYAIEQGILPPEAPFTVFNCAEYANNPELLTSKLFGHAKGAFTGADRAVSGLIETSNGGVLFIDEVHRLPPEGQEKLFHFMDNGTWRRLGESSDERSATVRLIFASTEDLEKHFLATFIRRIPVIVKILPIAERGQYERLAFIHHFFRREAQRLHHDLSLDSEIISQLMQETLEGNVGGLENLIRNICASAWTFGQRDDGVLEVKAGQLPDRLLMEVPFTVPQTAERIMIYREGGVFPRVSGQHQEYLRLTENICGLCEELAQENISARTFDKLVYQNLTLYLDALMNKESPRARQDKRLRFIEDVGKAIAAHYDLELNAEFAYLTGRYLTSLPLTPVEASPSVRHVMLRWLEEAPGLAQRVAQKLLDVVNNKYDLLIDTLDRLVVAAIVSNAIDATSGGKVKALIIAHGYSTASSIAGVANRLIGEKIYHAMDMPMEVAFSDVSRAIVDYLQHTDTRAGVMVLIDMGYTKEIADALLSVIHGPLVVVDNVTTRLALNVASEIALQKNIEQIAEEIVPLNQSRWDVFWPAQKKARALLVTCITGIGTAFKFKNLMEKSQLTDFDINIIACEYTCLKNSRMAASLLNQYEVIAVVGTIDPQLAGVPWVGIEELLGEQGYAHLSQLLSGYLNDKQIALINKNMVREFSLHNVVNSLTILNANKTIGHIETIIAEWQSTLGFSFNNNLIISLYVHLSCMIERLVMRNEITHYKNMTEFNERHGEFIAMVNHSFQRLKILYNVALPVAEIGYIHDIFELRIEDFHW